MRRILFDVPLWHVAQHRWARDLPSVDKEDSPERQLEDELFDRLYSGEGEKLGGDATTPLAAWALKLHDTCGELPAFERLAQECLGDADAAASAVETLIAELAPQMQRPAEDVEAPAIRKAIGSGCDNASEVIDQQRESGAALSGIAFKRAGKGTGRGAAQEQPSSRTLATRLKNDERLRRIALLAGKFKRIAARKQRAKVKHGTDEVTDIEMGSELSRLLPVELAGLLHPLRRLVLMRDLVENRALQYRMEGTDSLGKGPLVVCLDKSGSMSGASDIWATAVALALLDVAQRQKRPFALLCFDAMVKHEVFVKVGEPLPEDALFVACVGGTSIQRVLARGLQVISENPGAMRKADLLLITDGASDAAHADVIRQEAIGLGVTILGFGIGVGKEDLAPWCDEAHAVHELDTMDDGTADKLFSL